MEGISLFFVQCNQFTCQTNSYHSTFKVSKKYVSKELSEQIHKKADPFIKWLKEAEEETSDEEEDGVELEFDDRAKISSLQV